MLTFSLDGDIIVLSREREKEIKRMKTLVIKTVAGEEFTVTGNVESKVIENELIWYCNGQSFPDEIVKEVK